MKKSEIKSLAISIQKEALKEGCLLSKKDLDFSESKLSREDVRVLTSLIEDEDVLIGAGVYDKDLEALGEYIHNSIDGALAATREEAVSEMCQMANDFITSYPKLSVSFVLTQLNSAYKENGLPYIEGSLDGLVDTYHQIYRSEVNESRSEPLTNSLKETRNSKDLTNLFKANDTFEAACDKVVALLKDIHIEKEESDDADEVVENMEMSLTDVRKALKSLKKELENSENFYESESKEYF